MKFCLGEEFFILQMCEGFKNPESQHRLDMQS